MSTATNLVHLRGGGVSVLLDLRGDGVPGIAHWGADLGEADDDALAAAASAAVSGPGRDPTPGRSLLPAYALGHVGRPGLSGHRGGTAWSPLFTGVEVAQPDAGSVTLRAADDAARLELTTRLELAPSGVVRLRHELTNRDDDDYQVERLTCALPVPSRAAELLDLTGRWCRERHPQRHPLATGVWERENRRGRTGHDATIGLFAGTPGFGFRHGEVWAVHVGWSGNHVTFAEREPSGDGVIGGGELLLPGEVTLVPGETYATPWLHAAHSATGLDGIAEAFHGWLRARPGHPGPDRPRPLTLNVWEAVYFDHDLARLTALADVAGDLGVERYVLDDGWFRHRRDDTAGLGDWYVDETVWPDGLDPLITHVTGLGMQFGLWVEPEMVNPDSDLHRAHPDWVLGVEGRTPPASRHQQVLDLANPDAYAYILGRLDSLLGTHDIAYLKWDHNRDLVDAGHAGRAGVRAQTLAVYALLDELRARHPGVEIESCSSGGGRIDFGILARTDRVWVSDSNDALERQTIQRWTGMFLPPELMGAHIGPPRSHTSGRTHDLSFRAATATFGHPGIEWDVTSASAAERAALAEWIAFVKAHRGLLHGGRVVHADPTDASAWTHGVVAPDGSAALYAHVQLTSSPLDRPAVVRLPGLRDDRRYGLRAVQPAGAPSVDDHHVPGWYAGGQEIELSGRLLATMGLAMPMLHPEQALLLHLTAR